ncbi:hypothetical protein B0H14DRAFT_763806 [Mycena olivaceomarginata]|nr:hypothetical protein B0H14DRAFT_763806 [Mycena olivaceomarginata]
MEEPFPGPSFAPLGDRLDTLVTLGREYSWFHRSSWAEEMIRDLLERIRENRNTNACNFGGDCERQQHQYMAPAVVVIHGIHDSTQASEVYGIIKHLTVEQHDHRKALDIIVISTPQLLRHVSRGELAIMDLVHTLSVLGIGSIVYSGNPPALPLFHQNLFRLVLDGIFMTANDTSARLWFGLFELEVTCSSTPPPPDISEDMSIATIFHVLHKASEHHKLMIKVLSACLCLFHVFTLVLVSVRAPSNTSS